MSLDSGSSTDADVDSDSGSWSSRSSRSLVYSMTRKTEDSQKSQPGLCEILLLVGGPGKMFWLGLPKCGIFSTKFSDWMTHLYPLFACLISMPFAICLGSFCEIGHKSLPGPGASGQTWKE
jgi:hypothetical protein